MGQVTLRATALASS
uniref:Uncharacterized protein MANES_17G004800 n=1 Tax=Rhizophora mucronata TaxID=61149 RepID=A0A2P2JMR0_RHIMU